MRRVPLNAPSITEKEIDAVTAAIRSTWVTTGPYVTRFEDQFAARMGRRFAVTTSSGTMALWLAYRTLGLERGAAVAVPAYTCDAVANAAHEAGAEPVFVDCDPGTWGMDHDALVAADLKHNLAAVVLVHTYGVPAVDTRKILAYCSRHRIPLIEDASEAHGAAIDGKPVGSFGEISIFSCRGEKLISGAQMGVLLTDDEALARRARSLANNGLVVDELRFYSVRSGLNLMTSNLHAALALAQLERLDELIAARRSVHSGWMQRLGGWGGVSFQSPHGAPVWWLTALCYDDTFSTLEPRDLMTALKARGIETRPAFMPLNRLPQYRQAAKACPVSEALFGKMIILPSGPTLTGDDLDYVTDHLLDVIGAEHLRRAA